MDKDLNLAVLIPCHNEEATIKKVVSDFNSALPHAIIYVYDNASTDSTSSVARKAGALVFKEPNKGKGNVIRRMFADLDADIFIMVDGDATYEASMAPTMIDELVENNLDINIGYY